MPLFQAGDQVCISKDPTGTVKHHAIVVTAETADGWMEIVEYGVFDKDSGKKKVFVGHGLDVLGKDKAEVRKNRVNTGDEKWREVEYKKRDASVRPPADVVRAANFLVANGANLLPKYHITFSNGECVARWCKTSNFSSGQADKLYGSVTKAEKVSRVLPVASAVSGKSRSASSGKSSSTSSTSLATVAMAVGSMVVSNVDKRREQVSKEWEKTNQILDDAYASFAR